VFFSWVDSRASRAAFTAVPRQGRQFRLLELGIESSVVRIWNAVARRPSSCSPNVLGSPVMGCHDVRTCNVARGLHARWGCRRRVKTDSGDGGRTGLRSDGCLGRRRSRSRRSRGGWGSLGTWFGGRWPGTQPPRYVRVRGPSVVDAVEPAFRALLAVTPTMPATVIAERGRLGAWVDGAQGPGTGAAAVLPAAGPGIEGRARCQAPAAVRPVLPARVDAAGRGTGRVPNGGW